MEPNTLGYAVVTPEEVASECAAGYSNLLLLDVRTPAEYRSRRIPGARRNGYWATGSSCCIRVDCGPPVARHISSILSIRSSSF